MYVKHGGTIYSMVFCNKKTTGSAALFFWLIAAYMRLCYRVRLKTFNKREKSGAAHLQIIFEGGYIERPFGDLIAAAVGFVCLAQGAAVFGVVAAVHLHEVVLGGAHVAL